MLEEFLGRPKTAAILQQGWVDLMIDVDRDTNGKKINERLMNGRNGGLPWLIVLDADGKEIVTSNEEPGGGNIGAPVQPNECTWFGVMMERSRGDKVGKEQLEVMLADLEEFAKPKRRR